MLRSPSGNPANHARSIPATLLGLRQRWLRGVTWLEGSHWRIFAVFLAIAAVLYVRSPFSNSIFDEQEALVANPYVNGKGLGFFQVLRCDFWGLPPDRSIGSYRPIPNLIWRSLWTLHDHPWLPHAINVVLHALNALLVLRIARAWTASNAIAWLSGICFVCCAVLTETVSGVVGLADVLSGVGLLLAIAALTLPVAGFGLAAFAACTLAMFSKESSVAIVVILPWAALLSACILHPNKPRVVVRVVLAALVALAALVLYVETRRRLFPSPIDQALLGAADPDWHWLRRGYHDLLRWFAQPKLPHDPINNPLVGVPWPERVATAFRIYMSGLGQVIWPMVLSGDYSYAAELPEKEPFSVRAVVGAFLLGLPLLAAPILATIAQVRSMLAQRRVLLLIALALLIVPVSYVPQSNILVLLPTIRAERFWYLPVVGATWLLGCLWAAILSRPVLRQRRSWLFAALALFLGFQAVQARRHAFDYSSDLHFWRGTAQAVPNSAKAHLNYGVMLGARGDLEERSKETARALQIAPQWPMAHVYLADTLCRLQRPAEAWPHYLRGFEIGPNEPNLIALGLQCLWDQQQFASHQVELMNLGAQFPGSWLDYLVTDTFENGTQNGGVSPKYRPRGYDEGPSDP
ncbi:MAG TPA: tetratricopeptide repeat protein [Polyangiaceae bacterium]|nr:tetratricopeptide repeat protein [Polyangiaceae bacterium]